MGLYRGERQTFLLRPEALREQGARDGTICGVRGVGWHQLDAGVEEARRRHHRCHAYDKSPLAPKNITNPGKIVD